MTPRRRAIQAFLGLLAAGLSSGGVRPALAAQDDAFQIYDEESNVHNRLGWSRVLTASREGQSSRKAPMSVEVITAEDIRASGAVNLWDLLRFRAGVDVDDAQNDGLAVVSIRGFARTTIRQLQVLVDGRSVYSPSRSAVNWEQLPVELQDIERIEIVRGPNAVLYGSNAAVGVVNIITKKPSGRSALWAGARAGSQGLLRTEAAASESIGDFHYRLSQTHASRGGTALPGGGAAGDFLFSNKQNFRGSWDLRRGAVLDLFAGGSWDTLGQDALVGQSGGQSRYREHFEMARLTQELKAGELELSGSRNEVYTEQELSAGLRAVREFQYDGDAVYRLGWLADRLHTVAGAGYRLAVAESDQLFAGDPRQQNRVLRGFLNQSAALTERITLVAGASWERSDTGGGEAAYQAAAIAKASKDHFFRLSCSLAPSLPSLFDKHARSQDSPTKRRIGNPSLDSDHLRSYELGYQGLFLERLGANASVFYLVHRDLNESFVVGKAAGVTTTSFHNDNAAIARGAEASLTLKLGWKREVYANYTYERVTDHAGNLEITRGVPQHKFNAGGRAALGRGFSIGANLGYKDAYAVGSPTSGFETVPAYWRLDARLGFSPRPGVELFLAGQNLARPFHGQEFQHSEAVPRQYQGGVSIGF